MPATSVDAPRLRLTATQRQLVELFDLRGPAAATNWVRRYGPDPETGLSKAVPFPQPDDHRRYDLDDVVAWARRDDTPAKLRPKPAWWWRRAVAAWQAAMLDEVGSGDEVHHELRSYVAALVLGVAALAGQVRRVRPRPDLIEQLRRVGFAPSAMEATARELEASAPELAGLLMTPLRQLDEPAWLHVDFIDHLERASVLGLHPADQLDIALDELGGGRTSPSDTDPVLTKLITNLIPTSGVQSVYDPCAGEGGLLAACAGRADVARTHPRPRARRRRVACIARTRFLLHSLNADVGQAGRSSIGEDQFPTLRADLVVADPPVSPNSPLADWVDHAFGHLAPRGRALIVLPLQALVDLPTTTARRRPEKDLTDRLDELLDQGAVARVVDVPLRLRRDVAGSLTVWELRERHAGPQQLAFRWAEQAPRRTTSTNSDLPPDAWREHPATPDEVWQWLKDPSTRPGREADEPDGQPPDRPSSRLMRAIDDLDVDLGSAPTSERRAIERKLDELGELLDSID